MHHLTLTPQGQAIAQSIRQYQRDRSTPGCIWLTSLILVLGLVSITLILIGAIALSNGLNHSLF